VRTWLPFLLVLAAGCATMRREKEERRSVASLELVRAGTQGACGAVSGLGGDPWSADRRREPQNALSSKLALASAEACARFDPAGREEAGEGAVLAVTLVFADGDDRFRPEHWHVEVVARNGLVVQAGMLGEGRLEKGSCVLGVCAMEGRAVVALPEPWRQGPYKVRLTHVPTALRVGLSFELQ
jgi:hypothetical protein